jgi:hypothetical protein
LTGDSGSAPAGRQELPEYERLQRATLEDAFRDETNERKYRSYDQKDVARPRSSLAILREPSVEPGFILGVIVLYFLGVGILVVSLWRNVY